MQELPFLLIEFPCLKIMMEIVRLIQKLEQGRFLFTCCWTEPCLNSEGRDNTSRTL